jgi:hypothetical protein
MKLPALSVFAFLTASVSAGTISLPDFGTTWKGNGTYQSHVESMNQWTVNLDDRSGLTPGAPIKITVTTSDQFLWLGSFRLSDGPLSFTTKASLGLIVGEDSGSVTSTLFQDFGVVTGSSGEPNTGVSDIVGYMMGPGLPALELVVPWSADLTNAIIRLSQVSDISGTGNAYGQSGLHVSGGQSASQSTSFTVSFTSIPEPTSSFTLILGLSALSLTRRRCPA